MSIFKDCDIRGVVGAELDENDAFLIGKAIGSKAGGRQLVCGGDFRLSTPELKARAISGMLESGADVIDLGQLPTPAVYFAKNKLGVYGAVQVTASHNPAEYNGFKVMLGELPVLPADITKLSDAVSKGLFTKGEGKYYQYDIMPEYEQLMLSAFGARESGLRVVVDAGNGAMGEIAPRVFEKLGFSVVRLFCNIDGSFKDRDPNPAVYKNIHALREAVVSARAELGVAFDGDGDRAIFVDGEGTPLLAEEALCVFMRQYLKPDDTVIYDIKSCSIVEQQARLLGAKAVMERSGHAFIKRTLLLTGAALGGEVSGHYFFRELGGDDGLYAAIRLCSYIMETGCSLRGLLSGLKYPVITRDIRLSVAPEQMDALLVRFEDWAKKYDVIRLDGIRAQTPEGAWVLLRKSVTEPAVTLRFEAPEQSALNELMKDVENLHLVNKSIFSE